MLLWFRGLWAQSLFEGLLIPTSAPQCNSPPYIWGQVPCKFSEGCCLVRGDWGRERERGSWAGRGGEKQGRLPSSSGLFQELNWETWSTTPTSQSPELLARQFCGRILGLKCGWHGDTGTWEGRETDIIYVMVHTEAFGYHWYNILTFHVCEIETPLPGDCRLIGYCLHYLPALLNRLDGFQ